MEAYTDFEQQTCCIEPASDLFARNHYQIVCQLLISEKRRLFRADCTVGIDPLPYPAAVSKLLVSAEFDSMSVQIALHFVDSTEIVRSPSSHFL